MLLKKSKNSIIISAIIIILAECHTVSVKMGDENIDKNKAHHISLQHYSTIMGWKEIVDPKTVRCPNQDGNVMIQEDIFDALIYFVFAPFLISESIEVFCTEGS